MFEFGAQFFICNIFISLIVGIIFAAKHLLKNHLSPRTQYHIWFIFLGLLAVPFIPVRLNSISQFLSKLKLLLLQSDTTAATALSETPSLIIANSADRINDFAVSVSRNTGSWISIAFVFIWCAGILFMICIAARSQMRLHRLKRSALPVQSPKVQKLYQRCISKTGLKNEIPIYSTAFLSSPVIAGLFSPRIYLPIHLISDFDEKALYYMILHELQHYRHKDSWINYLVNLAQIIYWFNPFVWSALKEMRCDREIACDTSVLQMLNKKDYIDYGNTLLGLAEKLSAAPFSFTSGIGGSIKQIKKRILNIAAYKSPTARNKVQNILSFTLIVFLLLCMTPVLSINAAGREYYRWNEYQKNVNYVDYSSYFGEYDGSFVLYDPEKDSWEIYNKDHAVMRTAPNSTYKVFDALFALESGVITPEQSQIAWDGKMYSFDAWNQDQNLHSAMSGSVNWYFQSLDRQIGYKALKSNINKIGYGNQDISGGLASYWMESSLSISPVEQVQLLTKLYKNELPFSRENMAAVKDAMLLSSADSTVLHGKTGTGQVNGDDINGWFIGYIEMSGHTCIFATNIQADKNATGSEASDITLEILKNRQNE